MWCIIVLGAIGLIAGIVLALVEGDISIIVPTLVVGVLAGLFLAVIISVGTWICMPSDGYIMEETQNAVIQQNAQGELLYFKLAHDGRDTRLHYMNTNNEIKQVSLNKTEVRFISAGETPRIERYTWRYKSDFLHAVAFIPLTRMNSITYIHISESDWYQHTDGGIEAVTIQPVEN